jgi:hypothetical protein
MTYQTVCFIFFDAILFEYTNNMLCAFTYVPPEHYPVYGDEKDGIVNLETHLTRLVLLK